MKTLPCNGPDLVIRDSLFLHLARALQKCQAAAVDILNFETCKKIVRLFKDYFKNSKRAR